MQKTNNFKFILYLVLIFVSIAFLVIGQIYPQANSLCENLAAGSIWALFTVMVIDKISQISQKEESKKIRYMAFKDGVNTLELSIKVWNKISTAFAAEKMTHYNESQISEIINHIDLNTDCPGASTWTDHLQHQANQIQRYIDKALKFESFLDLDYVYVLGELDDCDLLDTIRILNRHPNFGEQIKKDLPSYLNNLRNLEAQLKIIESEFKKLSDPAYQSIKIPELNF